MKQPYKVQNRTTSSRRVKFVKNGGTVSFPKTPTASFVENSREAGFCLTAITPLPSRDNATNSITLTSHPMGTDGRVSLYINDSLIESKRFASLSRITDRQAWFNREFGAYVTYTGKERASFTSVIVSQDVYRFVFEDDDIDFIFADTTNAVGDVNPTLIVEQYRLAFNIMNNKIEISCDGAIDFAGALTFNDEFAGNVSNSNESTDYVGTEEWITAMETKGFTVVPLEDWSPRQPEEYHPRFLVQFADAAPVSGVEPSNLTVELTDKFNRKTVYSGKVSEVMDQCRLNGILLQYSSEAIRVGTEPGTPFTKVKLTVSDRQFDPLFPDSWRNMHWKNPTVVLSNNNRTITGNFGWDNLLEFWCFSEFTLNGAEGNAGDVLQFANIDFKVENSISNSVRNVTVDTDFTETCSWNTQNPIQCQQLHQVDEAITVINERLHSRGGLVFNFNQNPVWGITGDDGQYLCSVEDYVATAICWMPNSSNYGYSIPEPELPM